MKLPAAQKTVLGLLAAIAAAALCALPFLAVKKDIVYVYAKSPVPDSRETGFIRELKRLGYEVKLNSSSLPAAGTVGLWFRPPEFASQLETSPAAWNFIYNEDYYPFDWRGLKKFPVVLTPYRELYEHYARSNIRTAMFTVGVNTTDFYAPETVFQPGYKVYPLVYYGDNNKSSPVGREPEKTKRKQQAVAIGRKPERPKQYGAGQRMVYGPLLGKRAAAAGAAGNAGGKGQGAFPRFYRCRIRRSRNACRQNGSLRNGGSRCRRCFGHNAVKSGSKRNLWRQCDYV